MLSNHPEICMYVRSLSVRPNYYLAWPKPDEALDEEWVAATISRMAKHFTLLDTFDWDGLEAPPDTMWNSLRRWYVRPLFLHVRNLNKKQVPETATCL